MPINRILQNICSSSNGIIGAVLGDSEGERIGMASRADVIELDVLCAYASVLIKGIHDSMNNINAGNFLNFTSLYHSYQVHIVPFRNDIFLTIIADKKLKPLRLEQSISSCLEELKREIE